MTSRVSPKQQIRIQIDEAIAGSTKGSLIENFEQVAKLAVKLVMQTALEEELTQFLGRERYERSEGERAGSRNGYQPNTVKTTAGEVTLYRPKVRGITERFASRMLGTGVTRTNALESLVIAGFVRGLSTRDVEASLAEALGPEATISRSTVSNICQAIKTEFDTWKTRDLSQVELEYLFIDGSHFKMHPGSKAEPVLVAWGITAQPMIKSEYWAVFDIDAQPGEQAVAQATCRAKAFSAKWGKLYPSAVACLSDDFEALTNFLRFPSEHWSRIRHSNFIERTFGESRRRVKVIGRFPGEQSCLSLVWAVLDRASRGWRGVNQNIASIRLLAEIRREMFKPPTKEQGVIEEAVTPAA